MSVPNTWRSLLKLLLLQLEAMTDRLDLFAVTSVKGSMFDLVVFAAVVNHFAVRAYEEAGPDVADLTGRNLRQHGQRKQRSRQEDSRDGG